MITIWEKIYINHPVVIRYVVLLFFGYFPHIIIKYRDPVFVPVIFINQEVAVYFSDYFKIQTPCIVIIFF